MTTPRMAGAALLALLAAAPLPAQETARTVIEKAVQAHGGYERLSRVRAERSTLRGTLYVNDSDAPFRGETTMFLPGRFRNVLTVTGGGRAFTILQILNGDRAWVALDGQPQKIQAGALAELRMAFHLQEVLRLAPLLTDRRFTLTLQADERVADRPAAVVLVSAPGRRDVRLSFDRASGLLVKSEYQVGDPAGKEAKQEIFYGDWHEMGGYLRPVKLVAYRDGKKIMEAELLEVKALDRVDAAEFEGP